MRTPKFVLRTIIVSILLILAVSCSASQPESTPELPEPRLTQPPTPTYAVELLDSGAPLEPKVLATSPDGGQELAASGAIEVVFDQPMDLEETTQAWSLLAPDGRQVPGEIQWPDPNTLVYWPKEPLERGQVYRAELSTQTTSAQGVQLSETVSFDVNVAGDLQISQVFPADGTQEVEANASITVIFNRPVVPLTMVEARANLPQPLILDPEVAGEGEWLSTSVYIFEPSEALRTSTTYTARVNAGLSDTLGSELVENYEWQFTTAAPSIAAYGLYRPNMVYYPENNYPNVYLESSFVIEFRQPMEAESTEQAFSLNSQAGEPVAVAFEWLTGQQLVITPTRQLSLGTDYTLILSENARTTYGGTLADSLRWNFRTLLAPAIIGTTPADGTQPTYFSDYFSIQFASPMRLDTIKPRVIITPALETPVQWYYDTWSWRAEFYGLKAATDYTVEFRPGMEDTYGNQITTASTVSFRTGVYQPSARFDLPYAPSIYRPDGPQNFYASYVNVDDLEFSLFRLSAADFAGFTSGYLSTWDFVPPESNLLARWQVVAEDVANQRVRLSRPLANADGLPLSPGFYFLTLDSPQVDYDSAFLDTRLIVVANANLTYKATTAEVMLWVTDLETGAPLADVPLEIYDGYNLIAQGST
ncbi:MAG: Ig-like domain-containing protein, partial [Anaerolineales bacterium]|nr:Ig-like domain-containing protein [Anaerolineales bacterium]